MIIFVFFTVIYTPFIKGIVMVFLYSLQSWVPFTKSILIIIFEFLLLWILMTLKISCYLFLSLVESWWSMSLEYAYEMIYSMQCVLHCIYELYSLISLVNCIVEGSNFPPSPPCVPTDKTWGVRGVTFRRTELKSRLRSMKMSQSKCSADSTSPKRNRYVAFNTISHLY